MTLFYSPSENSSPLCLNVFKEADVFKGLSWFFHNEGPTYDKALKP